MRKLCKNCSMYVCIKKIITNKIVKNFGWLTADKIIRLLGGLLVGAWVARYLGPEKYGLINFVSSFAGLFTSFSMLGIDNIVIRELASKKHNINEILGTAVRIRNTGSIVSAIISLSIAYLLYYENEPYFLWLLLIIVLGNIFQSFDVITLWYQSQIEAPIIVRNKLISYIFISVLKVVAVMFGSGILIFVSLGVLDSICGVLLLARYYSKHSGFKIDAWLYNPFFMKSFLREGWLLALSNFCIMIFMRIDQVFLGSFLGNREVGIYAIVTLISDILYSIPMFVCSSTFPKLSAMYLDDRGNYEKYTQKMYISMVICTYCIITAIYLFSDKVVFLLYGQDFMEAADLVKIHVWSLLAVSVGCVRGNMTIIEHNIKVGTLGTMIASVFTTALNYYLISYYGIYGAAYATVLGMMFNGYFTSMFHKSYWKYLKMQTSSILLLPVWKQLYHICAKFLK